MMDSIVAVSTPYGSGGIAVIRVSGEDAFCIVDKAWRGVSLESAASHTAHLGDITAEDGTVLDNAVATVFRGPRSFTGENTVELSVHGSKWIQRQVVDRLVSLGARPAEPGEFTRRAFLNGRLDLAQAEGVADLIAASSRAAHRLAMSQMSGSFSSKLNELRDKLIDLASLLELELDFSEEEVEFADRAQLREIADDTLRLIERLASTYSAGKAFKEGVPVAIAGRPNAGKSTLLNALLDEDKAIVSDLPGTTRDVIDDTREIGGILFRFYDTAGLRETADIVEKIGIDRAHDAISRASIVLWVVDSSASDEDRREQLEYIKGQINSHQDVKNVLLFNKADISDNRSCLTAPTEMTGRGEKRDDIADALSCDMVGCSYDLDEKAIVISAKSGEGLETLKHCLVELAKTDHDPDSELIVTNARHHAALLEGAEALRRAREALETGLSADFIAQDIRQATHALAQLTGEVSTDTLLATIFSRFCIGK